MHKLLKDFDGRIRLVVKQFPFRYRDYSYIAAEASLAAAEQGRFDEMHELLLKRSPVLDRNGLMECAREAGLDMQRFTKALDGLSHSKIIERDGKLASELELHSTPTFFINGRKVVGNRPYEYFREIIAEELGPAKR